MSELFDGSIQASVGYNPQDLEEIKAQVDKQFGPDLFLGNFLNFIREAMVVGVINAGTWVAQRASELAPVETGRLKASGSVWVNNQMVFITGGGTHPSRVDTPELIAIIVFNAPYAFIQDTRTDFLHPRGGQAGYLSGTVFQNQGIILDIMSAPVKQLFEGI